MDSAQSGRACGGCLRFEGTWRRSYLCVHRQGRAAMGSNVPFFWDGRGEQLCWIVSFCVMLNRFPCHIFANSCKKSQTIDGFVWKSGTTQSSGWWWFSLFEWLLEYGVYPVLRPTHMQLDFPPTKTVDCYRKERHTYSIKNHHSMGLTSLPGIYICNSIQPSRNRDDFKSCRNTKQW